MTYSLADWLFFFFFYSFAGWIWESCYVSVRKKRWVNRGFLHLPLLPLYGSGAVVVLFVTIPVQSNFVLLYLIGMAAATTLELVTGLSMEALYKVKYWDYSQRKLNYKGVICLQASLLWGVFSIVMVKLVHDPVAHVLLNIPAQIICGIDVVVGVMFVYDFYVSNRKALQLARILTAMEKARQEMQEDLRKMEEELEETRVVLEKNLQQARAHAEEQREARIAAAVKRIEEERQHKIQMRKQLARSVVWHAEETKRRFEESMNHMHEHMEESAERLQDSLDNMEEKHQKMLSRMQEREKTYELRQEEFMKKAEEFSREMMKRNPTAVFPSHRDVEEELRRRLELLSKKTKQEAADE